LPIKTTHNQHFKNVQFEHKFYILIDASLLLAEGTGRTNMEDLKRNDIVQRSQGGPKMSIAEIFTTAENVTATCVWIDEKGDKNRQDFPVHELKLIER
jgi:uncharacterized protein YodC (DUF2158 family)